jgi:hypothetical protein
LARDRALLCEQQREVVHEAADAVAELDRAYTVMQTSFNRLVAARDQLAAVQAAYDLDKAPLDLLLEAQRRWSEASTEYCLNRARYAVATKNVHFVKGTLLEYDAVYLAEGPWPADAYVDAAEREAVRSQPRPLNYASSKAPVVSRGPYAQFPGQPGAIHPHAAQPIVEHGVPVQTPSTTPDSQSPTPTTIEMPPGSLRDESLPPPPTGEESEGSATIDPTVEVTPARYDAPPDAVDAETASFAPPLRLPPPNRPLSGVFQ